MLEELRDCVPAELLQLHEAWLGFADLHSPVANRMAIDGKNDGNSWEVYYSILFLLNL